jgi:hypothetical protein
MDALRNGHKKVPNARQVGENTLFTNELPMIIKGVQ